MKHFVEILASGGVELKVEIVAQRWIADFRSKSPRQAGWN